MGRGSVRKRGKTWYFVVDSGHDETGKRKQTLRGGFRTEEDAQKGLRQLQQRLDDGYDPNADRITFRAFVEGDEHRVGWLDQHRTQVEPSTLRRYESLARLYLLPRLGSKRLSQIRPAEIQGCLNAMDRSPRTIQHVRALASTIFADALLLELITRNPAKATEAPKAERPDLEVPTTAHVPALMAAAAGSVYETALWLSVFTGARRGEVLAVSWDRVDFDGRRIMIDRSLERLDGRFRIKEPKTKRSRREVAIPPVAVERLRRWKAEQRKRRLAAGPAWAGPDNPERDLVCEDGLGGPLVPDSYSKAFKRFAAEAGIPNARLHDLRHAAATLMMEAGVHPSVVSRSLGHASEAFTMQVYGHVRDEMLDQAADALGDAYRDLVIGDEFWLPKSTR